MAQAGIRITRDDVKRAAADKTPMPTGQMRKQFIADSIKALEPGGRARQFIISTGAIDRDNDTISPAGWHLDNFRKNPVVLFAHDYDSLPIARATDVHLDGGKLVATAEFADHPMAETCLKLIDGGFLRATSVGFRPMRAMPSETRDGLDFQEQELLEFSVVPVPANPEALIIASAGGIDVNPLKEWALGVVKSLAAQVKEVPPVGTASGTTCPACGTTMGTDACGGCGWHNPEGIADANDGDGKFDMHAAATILLKQTADPIRWNRNFSKAFDVDGEPLEPSRLELSWASRYLEVPVKDIQQNETFVPSARMGSFLSAMDETLGGWQQSALRNMTEAGREAPPVYETLQLNSTKSRTFLVEGTRFLSRSNEKLVSKTFPTWSGLYVRTYVRREQAVVGEQFFDQTWQRAGQLNFLKGEAFTLSGEFLDRGNLDWTDIFLEPKQEKVLRRITERIVDQGEEMESRGLMLMGPPGTGKTLGARVMMRQADTTTFIWISARDFFRAGAYGAFTYAFDIAAECAPTILCFEDVDSYLHGEVIDLLKTEMDGMKRRKGIQTIMTTNFPELVPDALIDRPGRFDELMEVDLPKEAVRARMLKAWLPELTEAATLQAAKDTDGYSGAHLKELATFTRTVEAEEKSTLDVALVKALDKLKEQRDLVASLRQAPDYRPRRAVRMLVSQAKSYQAKRGRVLSANNESKLRTARDSVAAAQEHMDAVLAQLEKQKPDPAAPEEDDEFEAGKGLAIRFADEPTDGIVLTFIGEEDALASSDDIIAALRGAVAETFSGIGPLVREQTQGALALARGRVD